MITEFFSPCQSRSTFVCLLLLQLVSSAALRQQPAGHPTPCKELILFHGCLLRMSACLNYITCCVSLLRSCYCPSLPFETLSRRSSGGSHAYFQHICVALSTMSEEKRSELCVTCLLCLSLIDGALGCHSLPARHMTRRRSVRLSAPCRFKRNTLSRSFGYSVKLRVIARQLPACSTCSRSKAVLPTGSTCAALQSAAPLNQTTHKVSLIQTPLKLAV